MSAHQYDSPLRWLVSSHSGVGVEHLVELDAYHGNGRCACPHFHYRLERKITEPGAVPSNATRCHHILEARDAFLDQMIKLIKDRQKNNGTAAQERQI